VRRGPHILGAFQERVAKDTAVQVVAACRQSPGQRRITIRSKVVGMSGGHSAALGPRDSQAVCRHAGTPQFLGQGGWRVFARRENGFRADRLLIPAEGARHIALLQGHPALLRQRGSLGFGVVGQGVQRRTGAPWIRAGLGRRSARRAALADRGREAVTGKVSLLRRTEFPERLPSLGRGILKSLVQRIDLERQALCASERAFGRVPVAPAHRLSRLPEQLLHLLPVTPSRWIRLRENRLGCPENDRNWTTSCHPRCTRENKPYCQAAHNAARGRFQVASPYYDVAH